MPYYHDELFNNPKEVIDYFLQNDWFRTKDKYDATGVGMSSMLFRGQSDAEWSLTPAAFRPNSLDGFAPQPPSLYKSNGEPLRRRLGRQLSAELQAINTFLRNADSLGISTPIDYNSAKHSTDLINSALEDVEECSYEESFPHESLHRAAALAQHHGVPTRFLDWTESPLIACYFAAYNASVFSASPPRNDQEIAVIFITVKDLYDKNSDVELIRAPRYENSHLLQQLGVFTSIKNANKFYIDNKRWPSLNDYSQLQQDDILGEVVIPEGKLQLNRVRLPASQANDLLKVLFDLNITRHSLMPTLDNAAKAFSYSSQLFKSR